MATSTALVRHDPGCTALTVTADERTAGHAKARRHSKIVRILRIALPAAGVLVVLAYAATAVRESGVGEGLSTAALQTILPENLTMNNPSYKGFGKDGSSYVLEAKTARQDFDKPNIIFLESITGTLLQPDKTKTVLIAKSGSFNRKSNTLDLFTSIDIASESGLKAKLKSATVKTRSNTVVTKEPVYVEFPAGTIRSNTMTLHQKTRKIMFAGSVETQLKPQAQTKKRAAPLPAGIAGVPAQAGETAAPPKEGYFAASTHPTDILSKRLNIDDTNKKAVFKGNVRVIQGLSAMTTPELEVEYASETGDGKAKKSTASDSAANAQISSIFAKGPVIMTRGADERVDCTSAEFKTAEQTAVLMGPVVMTSGEKRSAKSDRVDLDQKNDTALLTGNVIVQQGKNELQGRRLWINRKAGTAKLTSPPALGSGPGRIKAHLVQGQRRDKSTKKAKTTTKDDATPLGSFRTDPDAPIDIEADVLDIDDNAKTAIFRGDVHAAQGGFVIRTREMTATYTGDANLADPTNTAGTQKSGKQSTELTRIEARKDVVITSKDGQMARGDWAIYDAKANKATIGGEVTLSKDQNMVRGTRLVIDMTTGQSTIETDPNLANAQPKAAGWSTTAPNAKSAGNRGRPSMVLFPGAFKGQKKTKPKAPKPTAATSGWSTQTGPGPPGFTD